MFLKELVLNNIQSWVKEKFIFHKRLNVIVGKTDSGKSSIIRGIKWVITNRPVGDSVRRNDTKESSSTIIFDDVKVTRKKSKSSNQYEVDDSILQAIRMDLPEEVSTSLNIGEENIQSQIDKYFLLELKPGQRAKELNKVADLEEMDLALKESTRRIKELKKQIQEVNEDKECKEIKLHNTEWVSKADKLYRKITSINKEITALTNENEFISKSLQDIKEIENVLDNIPIFPSKKEINKLLEIQNEIETLKIETKKLTNLYESLISLKNQYQKKNIIIPDISELEKIDRKIRRYQKQNEIKDLVEKMNKLIKKKKDKGDEILIFETEYHNKLKKLGKCPTCGVKIK